MKLITAIIFLITNGNLSAQPDTSKTFAPSYIIKLVTSEDNMLIGMLLQVKDSSVSIYPGKQKEWNSHKPFKPVSFDYTHLKQISLQKKNARFHGMLIGGGIGISVFAASFLIKDNSSKTAVACISFPLIPVGVIMGRVVGSRVWKKFNINSNPGSYTSFKK